MINKVFTFKYLKYFTNTERRLTEPQFLATDLFSKLPKNSMIWKSRSGKHIMIRSSDIYESSLTVLQTNH